MTKQETVSRLDVLQRGKAARGGKSTVPVNPFVAGDGPTPLDTTLVRGTDAQCLAAFEAAMDAARSTAQRSVQAAKTRFLIEAGTALREIRDQELYRITHATFEAYVAGRWSLSRTRAWQLIEAAPAMIAVAAAVDEPIAESQAVILEPVVTLQGVQAARDLYQGQRLDDAHERLTRVSAAVSRTALHDARTQHPAHADRTITAITTELAALADTLGLALVDRVDAG